MINVSRVAGLGGNYQKKKIYAEEIVHYLLKHTSTKKQQKNRRGLILIYLFFHKHINVQITVENIKLYERIVDTSSTHRFKIFHKITDFWTVEKNIEFSVVNPIDILLVIPICFVDTNLLLKICYK